MNQFLRLLFGVGLALTEPRERHRVYRRVSDKLDDLADQASRGYDTATERLENVYRAARGEDRTVLVSVTSFVVGVGVGAGVGLLLAPASGKETRDNIADRITSFKSDMRDRMRSGEAKTA